MPQAVISDKKRTLIFINIVIACIASSMLATALTTALPPVIENFNISATLGQWLTSGYSLAMAITMPLTAFLINRFPTKRLYCTSVFIFIAGLIVCAFSINFPMMMIGRLIQAAGNGMLTSMAQVIVLSIFPPEKKGSAMGWYGLSVGAAPIIAPTIAGIMVDTIGWRMIFIVPLVIMVIAFICSIIAFDNILETSDKKFDVFSFIMSVFAFGGITLGIGNIGNYSFISPQVIIVLIIGITAAVFFAVRQFRLNEPFLELRILKNKYYAVSVLGSMMLYFVMMGSSIVIPLYIQQTLGLSATISALVTLPGSAATALVSPFAGKIYDKIGMRTLFIVGAVCLTLSNILMFFVSKDTSVWFAAAFNIIRNVAIGCMMMPLVTWGAGNVDKEKTSDATALLISLRTISGAIGSAVFVAVMSITANNSIQTYKENASMHGVNMTFLAMAVSCIFLLLLGILGTKQSKNH